jgi:hypothetical protein
MFQLVLPHTFKTSHSRQRKISSPIFDQDHGPFFRDASLKTEHPAGEISKRTAIINQTLKFVLTGCVVAGFSEAANDIDWSNLPSAGFRRFFPFSK